jgi:hypothetical protein
MAAIITVGSNRTIVGLKLVSVGDLTSLVKKEIAAIAPLWD